MTAVRPIIDGKKIKWTLEQQQTKNAQLVRVDWLRFTIPVDRLIPAPPVDLDWVLPHMADLESEWTRYRGLVPPRLAVEILKADGSPCYMTPRTLAAQGLLALGEALGDMFPLVSTEDSGMDFYAARAPLILNGQTVGFVLAGGRSDNQANTVHYNFFGGACLHFTPEKLRALADFVESYGGWITRCDLALDVWQGLEVETVRQAWIDGLFDVRGKRPTQREHGSWTSGHSRTFEIGSRSTGKMLRAYEKGDELFGHEANDPWLRLEVEYRSAHRVLEPEVLRRPGDFFAGAYPWLAEFVAAYEAGLSPAVIPTQSEVADKTCEAAVTRLIKWVDNTAGPSIRALWDMGGDGLWLEVQARQASRDPRRLRGFSKSALVESFNKVAAVFCPSVAPSFCGA